MIESRRLEAMIEGFEQDKLYNSLVAADRDAILQAACDRLGSMTALSRRIAVRRNAEAAKASQSSDSRLALSRLWRLKDSSLFVLQYGWAA